MPRQLHAIITGRVQGVGFRHNARRAALKLGLTGWVRNLLNGTVETLAVGDEDALNSYAIWLRQGPPGALVLRVEITWADDGTPSHSFEVV